MYFLVALICIPIIGFISLCFASYFKANNLIRKGFYSATGAFYEGVHEDGLKLACNRFFQMSILLEAMKKRHQSVYHGGQALAAFMALKTEDPEDLELISPSEVIQLYKEHMFSQSMNGAEEIRRVISRFPEAMDSIPLALECGQSPWFDYIKRV